ncbi:MAG: TonB family protein [Chlorobiaceae bacterium]|nr:TonB family protein [Chlorobiaceae bacterium]
MSSKIERVHDDVAREARKGWTFREEFLDTDLVRHISYGNLVLRREAHLYLTHGVIISVLTLCSFWLVSANWNRLLALSGLGRNDDVRTVKCYEIVTNVTQLPPPPPMTPPEPKTVKSSAPVEAPPNVGKIKKVAEAPAEQTLATQKEIKQAIQGGASQGSSAACETVEFVECSNPPVVLGTPRLIYPEMARIAGIEGRVFVRVLISEDGRAMRADIVKRVPADGTYFDKEAVRIAMESKYSAGQQNGKRVRVWMTIPVRFTLHGEG